VKVTLFCDGGVRSGGVNGPTQGKTGRTAVAYVIKQEKAVLDKGGVILDEWASVNEAEFSALLLGLYRCAELGVTEIQVKSDSQLVVNQMLGFWKCREARLMEYKAEVLRVAQTFHRVTYVWVPRHQNQHADRMRFGVAK
jgi:ribonuclease HI